MNNSYGTDDKTTKRTLDIFQKYFISDMNLSANEMSHLIGKTTIPADSVLNFFKTNSDTNINSEDNKCYYQKIISNLSNEVTSLKKKLEKQLIISARLRNKLNKLQEERKKKKNFSSKKKEEIGGSKETNEEEEEEEFDEEEIIESGKKLLINKREETEKLLLRLLRSNSVGNGIY